MTDAELTLDLLRDLQPGMVIMLCGLCLFCGLLVGFLVGFWSIPEPPYDPHRRYYD